MKPNTRKMKEKGKIVNKRKRAMGGDFQDNGRDLTQVKQWRWGHLPKKITSGEMSLQKEEDDRGKESKISSKGWVLTIYKTLQWPRSEGEATTIIRCLTHGRPRMAKANSCRSWDGRHSRGREC